MTAPAPSLSVRSRAAVVALLLCLPALGLRSETRDGGIDPWNLGKGDWIYFMSDATNRLGGNIAGVTNENSLMLFYKAQGIRYLIVKAATSDVLFRGTYPFPQFTSNLVNIAHANGLQIFGYNRSYGSNVVGEVAISDYVFRQGADGFVWDAEAEWESNEPWIGPNGPAKAWQLCSTVRSNWPTKFLAHAPFPIISYHASFPYKEFGYWSDTIMPQIYHYGWTGVKRSPSGGINWSDVNWFNWQNSLYNLPPTNINGVTVYWTNAIKPLAPVNHVYGPEAPPAASPIPDKDVMEFVDYLVADPNPMTAGGYKGVSFWRADLHGTQQWAYIKAATIGTFSNIVNNIVIDSPNAATAGAWTSVRTFYNGSFYGGTTDTNSFGTNYLFKAQGDGSAYVQFTPNVLTAGDYDVYEWHPRRTDAATSVPFVITHAGGATTVYANQRTNSGNWSRLGRFNFAAGTAGNIRLTDAIAESTNVALADGIKLVYVVPTNGPAAPTGLSAAAVNPSRIDLAWTDNATNEINFVVGRSLNAGGPYADIVTLAANRTNYSDIGLAENTTYYYVVRAVNFQGASTNSNEAKATTPPINPQPPAILTQPRSQAVLSGQSVTFSVLATGTTPLRYQWRFKDADLAGATASSFTIAFVSATNLGAYAVRITNAYGTAVSSNAMLGLTTLAGIGNNDFGQARVALAASNVIGVAAGGWHSLALDANGSVCAWGNNWNGQCNVPGDLRDAVAIAAGGYHSLAIRKDGSVAAWGANDYGQTTPPAGLAGVIAVAAGTWHSLALRADGAVVAWGDNSSGQITVPDGLTNAVGVAAGGNHSLALRADGTVVAWGENANADGIFVGQSVVPWGLSNVVAIAAGEYHSLAVRADGELVAWGDDSQAQSTPPAGLAGMVAAAGGAAHSVALKGDGSAAAWGANWSGQCDLSAALSNVIAVAAGHAHTLVLVEGTTPLPQLFAPAWEGGRFSALYQTLNRRQYCLEFKNSPAVSNWTALPAIRGNGFLRLLADPLATNAQRFYRARQW